MPDALVLDAACSKGFHPSADLVCKKKLNGVMSWSKSNLKGTGNTMLSLVMDWHQLIWLCAKLTSNWYTNLAPMHQVLHYCAQHQLDDPQPALVKITEILTAPGSVKGMKKAQAELADFSPTGQKFNSLAKECSTSWGGPFGYDILEQLAGNSSSDQIKKQFKDAQEQCVNHVLGEVTLEHVLAAHPILEKLMGQEFFAHFLADTQGHSLVTTSSTINKSPTCVVNSACGFGLLMQQLETPVFWPLLRNHPATQDIVVAAQTAHGYFFSSQKQHIPKIWWQENQGTPPVTGTQPNNPPAATSGPDATDSGTNQSDLPNIHSLPKSDAVPSAQTVAPVDPPSTTDDQVGISKPDASPTTAPTSSVLAQSSPPPAPQMVDETKPTQDPIAPSPAGDTALQPLPKCPVAEVEPKTTVSPKKPDSAPSQQSPTNPGGDPKSLLGSEELQPEAVTGAGVEKPVSNLPTAPDGRSVAHPTIKKPKLKLEVVLPLPQSSASKKLANYPRVAALQPELNEDMAVGKSKWKASPAASPTLQDSRRPQLKSPSPPQGNHLYHCCPLHHHHPWPGCLLLTFKSQALSHQVQSPGQNHPVPPATQLLFSR
ncbi:hypothetical protein FRC06_008346 [Ceratobasidium sp. 370]|nr:hypothetical protein FRC06_008346 [Ceratobasidium sp. 370]